MRALGALKALPSLRTPEVGPRPDMSSLLPTRFLPAPVTRQQITFLLLPTVLCGAGPDRSPRGQRALAQLCRLGGAAGLPRGSPSCPAAMLMAFISLGFDRQLKPDSSAAWS